tara:strand:+ start:1273 stop:1692 length:420 start_codon:yes stop_codon:yes gene_type:complete
MSSQKNKGDGYERELAKYFNEVLYDGADRIFRAPLSGGGRSLHGAGSADLVGTPLIWVEAKRTERYSPYPAVQQAEAGIEAIKGSDIPVVVNRKNRMQTGESLVTMRLDDWMKLYAAYLKSNGHQVEDMQAMQEENKSL